MKTRKNNTSIFMVVVILMLATLACSSSSNEGKVVSTTIPETDLSSGPATKEIQPTQLMKEVYNIGDLIEVEDHTIRLNSLKYHGNVIAANFTIENHGTSDLSVSSMLSFSAKKEDGTKLDQEIFDCGSSSLDGSVLPGDKLRGDICWSGVTPEDNAQIYYEASLFGQGAVVWKAIEGEAQALEPDTKGSSNIEVFKVGDIVEVKDHTIRLNSLEYRGTILVADFSVENHGKVDVGMSSMMSFSAKTSDGTKLEGEYFDCGTSSLDGTVLPGDRLRGTICWKGASPDAGIKIYYEASLFGEGAIVWDAVPGVAETLELTDSTLLVDVYQVGDVVQVKDHTITLNNASITGGVLKANFTLENTGVSDLNVSSMLSFSARKRDGSSLEGEYMSCGTSIDGSVIPGDKLKGDICWKGANIEEGIKIYYFSSLLSQGAVVWVVK